MNFVELLRTPFLIEQLWWLFHIQWVMLHVNLRRIMRFQCLNSYFRFVFISIQGLRNEQILSHASENSILRPIMSIFEELFRRIRID